MNVATKTIVYWTVTALFCLEMSFIAYNELASPQVVEVFARLGFPGHAFQVELSVAKVLGCWRCWYRWCRPGSRSGLTPASPSTSCRRLSPTSRWAMAYSRGAGRRSPACSEKDRAQFPSDAAGKRTAAKSRNPLVNGARALGKIHFRPMYAGANID